MNEIRYSINPAENSMALVEIEPKETYKKKDPKQAIRKGMQKTGRITQFMYPLNNKEKLDKEDRNRIINSFLDLLSDYGFISANIDKIYFPGEVVVIDILSRWNKQKKRREYLPVLGWYDGKQLLFKRLGDDRWLSIRQVLLQNLDDNVVFDNKDSGRLRSFLKQQLHEIMYKTDQTIYLMVKASLRFIWWEELQNHRISFDTLPLAENDLSPKDMSRLRVIRINTTKDVPSYDIVKDKSDRSVNKRSGLFKSKEGIYYSIGFRPSAWRSMRVDDIKLESPYKMLMKQNAVEIIPIGCTNEDERDTVASFTDKLRRTSITYDASTILPFPLHQLKAIGKYFDVEDELFDDDGFEEEVIVDNDNDFEV